MTSSRPLVSWLVASATSLAAFVAGCGSEATGVGSPDSVTPGASEESVTGCPAGQQATCEMCGPEEGCTKRHMVCTCDVCGTQHKAACESGTPCTQGHVSSATGLCETCGGNGQPCCDGLGHTTVPDCYGGTVCSYGGICAPPTACLTAAPDMVADTAPAFRSGSAAYAQTACGGYIVDVGPIEVSPYPTQADQYNAYAFLNPYDQPAPATQAECESTFYTVELWRMAPVKFLGASPVLPGQWIQGACYASHFETVQGTYIHAPYVRGVFRAWLLASDGVTKIPKPFIGGLF